MNTELCKCSIDKKITRQRHEVLENKCRFCGEILMRYLHDIIQKENGDIENSSSSSMEWDPIYEPVNKSENLIIDKEILVRKERLQEIVKSVSREENRNEELSNENFRQKNPENLRDRIIHNQVSVENRMNQENRQSSIKHI